jgi:Rha family phage regulatory protein
MEGLIVKHKVKGEDIPVTTSLKVAEIFDKEHKNVIRDIENLLDGGERRFALSSMFILSSYKSVQNKEHKNVIQSIENLIAENSAVKNMFMLSTYKVRGRDFKQYLLTQDGCALLVMGFNGAKATEFKVAYIQAFNEMKKELEDFRFLLLENKRLGYVVPRCLLSQTHSHYPNIKF